MITNIPMLFAGWYPAPGGQAIIWGIYARATWNVVNVAWADLFRPVRDQN